jgi:hypothetical protein
MSPFTVRPVRVADHMSVTVKVNGGAAQTAIPPVMAPFALGPDLDTKTIGFTWNHPKLPKGDSVEVTACAVVSGNAAMPPCWSRTVIVK